MMSSSSGALNLYCSGPALAPDVRDLAVGFANYAAVAVINAAVHANALMEVEQMRRAMASRAVIEQAKGIIIGERRCNAEEAFAVLRQESNRSNRKLREVAEQLVDGVSG